MPDLRKQAEDALGDLPDMERDLKPEEAQALLHELRVHQIELQLQNEELRRTWEELAQSKARYADLYDRAPVGYATLTPDGIIVEANQTLAELLGQDRQGLLGHPLHTFTPDKDAFYLHLRRVFKSGSPQTVELPLATPHDREAWIELRSLCLPGDLDLCRTTVADVTQRKSLERSIQAARNKAEAASRAKSEFLANMSHELRTPLHGILGMIELALRHSRETAIQEYLRLAKQSGQSLTDIIGDILDLSKIEAGRLELVREPFDPRATLETVFGTFSASAMAKGISLGMGTDPDVPQRLLGDQARLAQVLSNLMGNAVKYTAKGRIDVRLSLAEPPIATEPPGVRLLFTIKDTGIGIPPDKQESIFEIFSQVDSAMSRRYGGSGLGLTICKRLVEMMGGCIWLTSVPGEGSTFFFTALFGTMAEAGAGAQSGVEAGEQAAQPQRILRVLVAEDDPINRVFISHMLSFLGHVAVLAESGSQALERLGRERFDLVLMDIQMPETDGVKATKIIREGELPGVDPNTPVVALTAHALSGDRQRFLEAGMDDYLSKPIGNEDLERVLHWAAEKAAERERAAGPDQMKTGWTN